MDYNNSLHKWLNENDNNKKVFISYSHKDFGPFVQRFCNDLAKNDISFWLDKKDLTPSSEWEDEISKGIEEADFFIFFMSKYSMNRDGYCKKEISYAEQHQKIIIPVKIQDVSPLINVCTLQQIEMLNTFNDDETINEENYKIGFEQLVVYIKENRILEENAHVKLYKKLMPLPQISYFSEDKKIYGYDDIKQEMVDWMNSNDGDILLLVAEKGAGKSTFISNFAKEYDPIYTDNKNSIYGINFCKSNNATRCDTKRILMTLSFSLARYWADYSIYLQRQNLDDLEKLESGDLFECLFVKAFEHTPNKPKKIFFIIDGINAIENTNNDDYFPNFIVKNIPKKLGIKFILSSDSDINKLHSNALDLKVIKLDKANIDKAINAYLYDNLKEKYDLTDEDIEIIINKAEHDFLYVSFVVKEIASNPKNIQRIINELPIGMANLYNDVFKKIFNNKEPLKYEDSKNVLMVLVAEKQILTIRQIINILINNDIENAKEIVERTFVILDNYIRQIKLDKQQQTFFDNYSLTNADSDDELSTSVVEFKNSALKKWLTEVTVDDVYYHISESEANKLFVSHFNQDISDNKYSQYCCQFYITHLLCLGDRKSNERVIELLCDEKFDKKRRNKLGEHEAFKQYFSDLLSLEKYISAPGISIDKIFNSGLFQNYLTGYRKYLYNQKDYYKRLSNLGFTKYAMDYTEIIDNDDNIKFAITIVDYFYIIEQYNVGFNVIKKIISYGKDHKILPEYDVELHKMACLTFRKVGKYKKSLDFKEKCERINDDNDGIFNYDVGVVYLILGKIYYHQLDFKKSEETILKGIDLLKSTVISNDDVVDDFSLDDDIKDNKKTYVVDRYITSQNYSRFIENYTAAFYREIALLQLWNNNPLAAEETIKKITNIYNQKGYSVDRYYSRYLYTRLFHQIYILKAKEALEEIVEKERMLDYGTSSKYVAGQMNFFIALAYYLLDELDKAKKYIVEAREITKDTKEIYEICEIKLLNELVSNNNFKLDDNSINDIIGDDQAENRETDADVISIIEWIKYVYGYIKDLKARYTK